MLFSNLFLGHEKRKNGEPGGPVTEKDLGRRGMQAQEPQEEGSLHPSVWGSECEDPGATPPPAPSHPAPWGRLAQAGQTLWGRRIEVRQWTAWKASMPRRVIKFC